MDPQTFLLCEAHELRDVGIAGKIKFTFTRFMLVPENVDRNCVQPHRMDHLQTVGPVFMRHAPRMHLARLDLKRLPVEEENYWCRW